MSSPDFPLTQDQVNCSLAVHAVVRAKKAFTDASRDLASALKAAARHGFTESDVEAARPMVTRMGEAAQERITTVLVNTGAAVQMEQTVDRVVTDFTEDDIDGILFRTGWLAKVWGEGELDLSRWARPEDAWKAARVQAGWNAFVTTWSRRPKLVGKVRP